MGELIQYTLQGLAAGGFYALAALGLAVIFGVLGVVNFSHGACYMLGAVGTALLLNELGLGFWAALVVVPVAMFGVGVLIERGLVRWLVGLDPLYNFLLTFGLTLVLVDLVKRRYGVSGMPYEPPPALAGRIDIGGLSLSTYQVFAAAFSLLVVRRRLARHHADPGRHDRPRGDRERRPHPGARHQRRPLGDAGVRLRHRPGRARRRARGADSGRSRPTWARTSIIILFAVVVIGGLGSIIGAVVAGFLVGLVEALRPGRTSPRSPRCSIFVLMAAVILVRPAGLFGREEAA